MMNQQLTDKIAELTLTHTQMFETPETQEEYEGYFLKLDPYPKATSLICELDNDWIRFLIRWLKFGTPVEDVVAIIELCDTAGVHPKTAFGFADGVNNTDPFTQTSINFRISRAEFSKSRKASSNKGSQSSGRDRKTHLDKNFLMAAIRVYNEDMLISAMNKWKPYEESYTLLTFLRYLQRHEELKDYPIDWIANVLPDN